MCQQTLPRLGALAAVLLLAACGSSPAPTEVGALAADPASCKVSGTEARPAPVKHLFMILLENKGYDEIYGPGSPAVYLRDELTKMGQLLPNVYGTAHASTGNYLALISGQGPNPLIHGDCQYFMDFPDGPRADYNQLIGQGCVFPATIPTIADELEKAGYTWKGYMEDMALEQGGGDTSPEAACVRPDVNEQDGTNPGTANENYATRHNPFVFFHSIIDNPERCMAHDVDLLQLKNDLKSYATTPNYSFIVPNNCNNGHDAPCTSGAQDGGPGGLAQADTFLREWVPQILASEAFQRDGMLIVMFDEATPFGSGADDNGACCGEAENPGPNTAQAGVVGPGGGRYGAVVISRFTQPGSVNQTPYNHYSLLRTAQDLFNAKSGGYLGFAGLEPEKGMHAFGADVYNCGGI